MITIRAPVIVGSVSPTETLGSPTSEVDSGFRVSIAGGSASPAPDLAPRSLPPAVEPGLILALQEQRPNAAGQGGASADRDARRRGRYLIEALAALQRALLAGEDELTCLAGLTSLLEHVPGAQDPALGHLVAAIQLRGEIETLRHIRRLKAGWPA